MFHYFPTTFRIRAPHHAKNKIKPRTTDREHSTHRQNNVQQNITTTYRRGYPTLFSSINLLDATIFLC